MTRTLESILSDWTNNRFGSGIFAIELFGILHPGNLQEVLAIMPPRVLTEMAETVQRSPVADEGWKKAEFIDAGMERESRRWTWSEDNEWDRNYRRGIETLRAYLNSHPHRR